MNDNRLVVLVPDDMLEFLKDHARKTGVGNVSAAVRMILKQKQEEARSNA